MQVLKHGSYAKRFKCWRCNCVFVAIPDDIQMSDEKKNIDRGFGVYISCPECQIWLKPSIGTDLMKGENDGNGEQREKA